MAGSQRNQARRPAGGGRNNGTRGGRPEAQPDPGKGSGARPGGGNRGPGDSRPAGGRRPDGAAAPSAAGVPSPRRGQEERSPAGAPRWLWLSTLILSVCGLGMSTYLTIAHFTSPSIIACTNKGIVNCAEVTTSAQSMVFGIFPVAVLGLAFYVAMVAMTTPWAWRAPVPAIRWARLASAVAGIGFVLYLVYTELFTLDKICLECTSVHVITLLLFGLIVYSAAGPGGAEARSAR